MRKAVKIILLCLTAAALSSCGKAPQRELDEDGSYYAGVLKGQVNRLISAYFDGTKTLEKTCGNIQNRVSLYLSEQYR